MRYSKSADEKRKEEKMEKQITENGFHFAKRRMELFITESEVRMKGTKGFLCFKRNYDISIPISDILFYDYSAICLGLLGYKIRGGANDQFFMNGLKKGDCKKIRAWLLEHGMKLSSKDHDEGKTFSSTGFHPLSKESITVMDNGISHNITSMFKNRDSFVPYGKIDFFLLEKVFFFFKKITVIGQLSFTTRHSFSSSAAKQINAALKEHSVELLKGKTYHPHIFSGVRGRRKVSLILLEDKIVYMGPEFEYSETQKKFVAKGEKVKLLRSVDSYRCKPIFSLFKRTAYIKGTGSTDLRTDTALEQIIIFPGVYFFWWFCCGPIKEACSRLHSGGCC